MLKVLTKEEIDNMAKLTPEQFVYWLQGYAEVSGATAPTSEQWQIIKDHLDQVFHKVTPIYIHQPGVTTRTPVGDTIAQDVGKSIPPNGSPNQSSSAKNVVNLGGKIISVEILSSEEIMQRRLESLVIHPRKLC
jgi:hypothetical protein